MSKHGLSVYTRTGIRVLMRSPQNKKPKKMIVKTINGSVNLAKKVRCVKLKSVIRESVDLIDWRDKDHILITKWN